MRSIADLVARLDFAHLPTPEAEQEEKARRLAVDYTLRVETARLHRRAKAYFDLCDSAGLRECLDAIEILNADPARHHRARITALRAMPYHEYLLTDEWQETRQRALVRAGFRCQTCYARDRLNVHHRTYARLGEESEGDLTVLCEPCHAAIHAR
jgi:5-methylcytosine-specific restriction endonuclease McrA